jgi:hypothetical protein
MTKKPSAAELPNDAAGETVPANDPQKVPGGPVGEPTSLESATPTPTPGAAGPKQYDLSQNNQLVELVAKEEDGFVRREIGRHVATILAKHKLDAYTTLILYDNCDPIAQFHADQIYEAASAAKGERDIFLILQTAGGRIEPAYLISKTCSRVAKNRFVVAVPRRAKSAGTLICLGADEIHMGLMSELGPVDPQIDGYPALGLINSLHVIAETAAKHPEAAELFARYLSRKLDLRHLGYFVRVPESAVQYGERLLKRNEAKLPEGSDAHSVADRLVNHYKDHSFVIDVD